jgi:DNA-directed RNA polymerase specialized sigma24 family protein
VDELYEFFDFFDKSVEDVYSYILHRTRAPDKAQDITLDVYYALLQRRKFFWWKSTTQLPTAFALADKAIETMAPWESEAAGGTYLQELIRCVPKGGKEEKNTPERMRIIFHALRKLPIREQRMAVLHLFLHWPAEKTAAIVGRTKESIQQEYNAIMELLCTELQKEPSLAKKDVCEVLNILFCPVLRETRKRTMRLKLLERCRATPLSSMRFALPIGALLLIFSALSATYLVPTVSTGHSMRSIAAAQILLLDQEITARDTLREAVADLQSIVAYSSEEELTNLSIALAPQAMKLHLVQDKEIRRILERLEDRSREISDDLSREFAFHD